MSYNFLTNLKLKRYYTEPIGEYNVVSTVIFRLEDNYKDMSEYYNKSANLTDKFYDYFPKNFYLRIYFDDSIIKKSGNEIIDNEIDKIWIPLLIKFKKLNFVQLCKYKHIDFLKNNIFHIGLFGTLMRFLPLFDYKFNKNIKTVLITDIDVSPKYMNFTRGCLNYTLKHKLHFFFRTSFCKANAGYHQTSVGIVNTWLRIMAGTMVLNDYKFPKQILNDFFNQIHSKNYDENLSKFIKMDVFNMHLRKANQDKLFRYGLDEFFAMYLLKNILDNKIKFGYLSNKDIDSSIYFYYLKNNKFKDNKPKYKELLKKILGKYYNEHKNLQENYMLYEKTMYIFYSLYRPNKMQIDLANNTFAFFQEIKDKNLYDYYGFSINDVKCVLYQKNRIDLSNKEESDYYTYDYNDAK